MKESAAAAITDKEAKGERSLMCGKKKKDYGRERLLQESYL
jgi:hypothetical protein